MTMAGASSTPMERVTDWAGFAGAVRLERRAGRLCRDRGLVAGEGLVAAARAARIQLFGDAGIAVMAMGRCISSPMGGRSAGRRGTQPLRYPEFVARSEEELLVDAGTFTYVAIRNGATGSADRRLIIPYASTGWIRRRPRVRSVGRISLQYRSERVDYEAADRDLLSATCRYRGLEHTRRILFVKPSLILVVDDIAGPPGDHLIEQFWHSGEGVSSDSPRRFRLGREALLVALSRTPKLTTGGENGWRSRAMGSKEPAAVIRVPVRGALPVQLTAAIDLDGNAETRGKSQRRSSNSV